MQKEQARNAHGVIHASVQAATHPEECKNAASSAYMHIMLYAMSH